MLVLFVALFWNGLLSVYNFNWADHGAARRPFFICNVEREKVLQYDAHGTSTNEHVWVFKHVDGIYVTPVASKPHTHSHGIDRHLLGRHCINLHLDFLDISSVYECLVLDCNPHVLGNVGLRAVPVINGYPWDPNKETGSGLC